VTVPEQPSDPAIPTPPVPKPTPEEIAAQQAAAEKAIAEAALTEQIRALAAKIAEQAILSYDPVTRRKGIVASLQTASAPPTVTVTISGDTTVEIPGVRYYEHYPPAVGDVVHIDKQGTDLVAMGKIAEQYSETGWTTVSLAAGFTHNGNSNGNLMIRRVWDAGQWRVELQGGVNRSSGTVIATGLDAKYRPVNATRRTVLAARDANGSNVVKLDIDNAGNITMVGGTTGSHTHSVNITDNEHTHQIAESSHVHPTHDHSVNINDNAHTHDVINHRHGVNITDNAHNHSGGGLTAVTINGFTDTETGISATGTAVTIDGTTGSSNAGESVHTHGTNGALGTAVTINGNTDTETVNDPVWISFNAASAYYL
jgi:hypothetical protein